MITPDYGAQMIEGKYIRPVTFIGLSTDTKPVEGVANGSIFIEIDTCKLYFFDLDGKTWKEWSV